MGLINLTVYPRSTKGKNENRRTRSAGRLPAVLYGKDRESEMIELDAHDFGVVFGHLAGSGAIFSLQQEGAKEGSIALLREVQKHPVTDKLLHVDLFEIPRGVPVTVGVAIQVTGTSAAVKTGEGSVALSLDQVEISCRPSELPDFIEVDTSELELNDKIFVKDLTTPVGEIVSDPEMLVLNIKPATIFVEEEEEVEEGAEGAEGTEGEDGEAKGEGDDEKKDD